MWREIRNVLGMPLAALVVALACSMVPLDAGAGVITELRTNPVDAFRAQSALYTSAGSFTAQGSSKGSSSNEDGDVRPSGVPGGPHDPRDPVMLIGASEYDQIEQGLITEEEALSGCGASVAGGRAGFGALALVGLFLALRRRK